MATPRGSIPVTDDIFKTWGAGGWGAYHNWGEGGGGGKPRTENIYDLLIRNLMTPHIVLDNKIYWKHSSFCWAQVIRTQLDLDSLKWPAPLLRPVETCQGSPKATRTSSMLRILILWHLTLEVRCPQTTLHTMNQQNKTPFAEAHWAGLGLRS